MEQSKNTFYQQKEQYLKEKQVLDNLLKEKVKTLNIIAALQQDLEEQVNKAVQKLATENTLFSSDEYVSLKQEETGIKARIEYYNAYLEELDKQIYQEKENLYGQLNKVTKARQKYFLAKFNELFATFSETEKETLSKLYIFIKYSGKVAADSYIDGYKGTLEYAAKDYLLESISRLIDTEIPLDEEFNLPIFVNSSELKTPSQKHLENFNEEEKGFKKLINQLSNGEK